MHRGADVGAEQRQVLAQIEARAQLVHCRLARADLVGRRGGEQPGGQRLLAGSRARGAQQLEQRAAPEQIQVVGVGMGGWAEALARLATAGPRVLQPIKAAPVERDRTLGALARGGRVPMPRHQDGEGREGDERPCGWRRSVTEPEPREHACDDHAAEPETADALLAADESRHRRTARGETTRVLGMRVPHGAPG